MGIFEQLAWLIKKVKKLCCITDYTNLPEYTNNAAAIAAGLNVGQVYRNGDVLQVVH